MHRLHCGACGTDQNVTLVGASASPLCGRCYSTLLLAETKVTGAQPYRLSGPDWNEYAYLRGCLARQISLDAREAGRLCELVGMLMDKTPLTPTEDDTARRIVALALGG